MNVTIVAKRTRSSIGHVTRARFMISAISNSFNNRSSQSALSFNHALCALVKLNNHFCSIERPFHSNRCRGRCFGTFVAVSSRKAVDNADSLRSSACQWIHLAVRSDRYRITSRSNARCNRVCPFWPVFVQEYLETRLLLNVQQRSSSWRLRSFDRGPLLSPFPMSSIGCWQS